MNNRLCILSVLLVVGALQGVSGLSIDTLTPTIVNNVNNGLPDGGTVGFESTLTQHCLQMDERRECVTLNFSAAQPCLCIPYL